MSNILDEIMNQKTSIDLSQIDLQSLLGRKITVTLKSNSSVHESFRVIMVSYNKIVIDNRSIAEELNEFNSNCSVEVSFIYKDQRLTADAQLTASSSKKRSLLLNAVARPASRRRFKRFKIDSETLVALLPRKTFVKEELETFKWFKSKTFDLSSGGMMLTMNNNLNIDSYVVIRSKLEQYLLPQNIVAQVKYSHRDSQNRNRIGMEFIVSEEKQNHFKSSTIDLLPKQLFKYDKTTRDLVNAKLIAGMH